MHLKSTSQLTKTGSGFCQFCKWYGEKLTINSHLFYLQEALEQNKISVLDPHLCELCKVWQDLSVNHLGWLPFVLSHPEHIKHAGMEGVEHSGMAAEHGLRSLWISVPLWEASFMCLRLRTGSYFTFSTRRVFLHVTASLFSWLTAHSFIIIPSYFSLTPATTHLCPTPKEENNFLLNLGQGNSLTEEATPQDVSASLRHGSKIWAQFQTSQRKERKKKGKSKHWQCPLHQPGGCLAGAAACSPLCLALIFPVPMTSSITEQSDWKQERWNRVYKRGLQWSLSLLVHPSEEPSLISIPGEYFRGKENVEDRCKTHEALDPVVYSANKVYSVRINKQTKIQKQTLKTRFIQHWTYKSQKRVLIVLCTASHDVFQIRLIYGIYVQFHWDATGRLRQLRSFVGSYLADFFREVIV